MNNKLKISVDILKEIVDSFQQSDEKRVAEANLQALQDFLYDDEIRNQDAKSMESISYEVLLDTLELCLPYLYQQYDMLSGSDRTKCDRSEAQKMLLKEFKNKDVWDEVASMNINDWIDNRRLIIEKKTREKKKSIKQRNPGK